MKIKDTPVCKGCGKCCAAIKAAPPPIYKQKPGEYGPAEDWNFVTKNWLLIPFGLAQQLRPDAQKRMNNGTIELIYYKCKQYDYDTKKCRDYENRPTCCKEYYCLDSYIEETE